MRTIRIDPAIEDIIAGALEGEEVTRANAIRLLSDVAVNSFEMAMLCGAADQLSRARTGNLGEVFSQIGINIGHCTKECDFCVLRAERPESLMSRDHVVERALAFVEQGANTVGLMVTADYAFEEFLEVGRAVRAAIPDGFPIVGNVGDFDEGQAEELVSAGYTAVYHVIRLREGIDTRIEPWERKRTLAAARAAGLDVSYCVEPIGPEHGPEELVDAMLAGKEFEPTSMATMRRVAVHGTPLASRGQISEVEQARVQAVMSLLTASWNNLMMLSAHEPAKQLLRSGAHRVTAEGGVNPRDTEEETSSGRGFSVAECRAMLVDAGWELREGPSPAMLGPLRGRQGSTALA
ncbi:MAG: radical SAM protein [Acidobacteriota bacterium]|nr:radical SAM protein [Acidobacteriota bacterium]